METEKLKLDSSTDSNEKIEKGEAKNRLQEVADIQRALSRINSSKYPDIEAKLKNKPQLQKDIWDFIEKAANQGLTSSMKKLQASHFDNDGKEGLSKFEFEKFLESTETTIEQIILLGSTQELSRVYDESANPTWYEIDKKIAERIDFQKLALGEKGSSTFMENLLQSASGLTEEQREKIGNQSFSITSSESYKNLGLYVAKDIGDGLESIMRFLLNMPAGMTLLPRYLNYRYDRNFGSHAKGIEADIKIQELTHSNPSLQILELLGEKGVELLKSLFNSMKSGKIKDISMIITTIAGLLSGGAALLKFGAKGVGKVSSGKVSNFAGKVEKSAGKISETTGRIDNAISSAGISELSGVVKISTASPHIETLEKRVFSSQEMLTNSKLADVDRIKKAEEYLGIQLNQSQKDALIDAHNYADRGTGTYNQGEKNVKGLKLMRGGVFNRQQAEILLDSALAGAPDKILAGLSELKTFDNIGKKDPDFELGLKILFSQDSMENFGYHLSELLADRTKFLDKFIRYGNDTNLEFKYSGELENTLKEMEVFLKSKNLPTNKIQEFIRDYADLKGENIPFSFLSEALYDPFHTLHSDKNKLASLTSGTLNIEKTTLRSERLNQEIGLDITRFPDFDKVMPPELIKALNGLIDIYKQKGNKMLLSDIPDSVKNPLRYFGGGPNLLNFINEHGGGKIQALSMRVKPTETIHKMYEYLTNLMVENGRLQPGDFNDRLNVATFSNITRAFGGLF